MSRWGILISDFLDDPYLLLDFIAYAIFSPLGPLTQYKGLVEQGKLQYDPYQEKVALELENLLGRLEQYEKDMEEYHV